MRDRMETARSANELRRPRLHALLALGALALAACAAPVERAFVGGKLWTGDPAHPWATALAVRGDRLAAVGSDAQIRVLCTSATEVVDLHGRFVCPGFIDAHLHFLVPEQLELDETDGLDDLQRKLRDYASAHRESAWIAGRGWGYAAFPNNAPHKRYLDQVVGDRPVILEERDGHMAVCNSKALELAGVTRDTRDPEHGRIVRDERGEPTGELQEAATGLVSKLVPDPSDEELYGSLLHLFDRAASYGLTSACNASYSPDALRAVKRAARDGRAKLRFYWAVPFERDASDADFAKWRALQDDVPRELVEFGCAKGFVDGVVDAQTAAMFEPYTTGRNGIAMWEQRDLDETAARYDRAGFQILLHAIGDKAIAMALDAYEHVRAVNGPRDSRHRIEHIEVPRLSDLPRFRELGVIASTQALFAEPDQTTLVNYSPLLGPERASHANAFKLFDDAGAVQAFGSDWPVFSMEVLHGIYCAASRTTREGTPAGGYFPEHKISVEAALHHFTVDAAYACFDERVKGSLAAGKLAEFVVLSDDILEPPLERVLATRVLLTVMGGRETFRANDF
jgi:predicted amidohydrolase YtcJ